MWCYPHFILTMDRSHGFAFAATYYRPIQTRFRCGCVSQKTYPRMGRAARWLIKQKARRHTFVLRPFVSTRFQILFTPFSRVLFTFPSRYWFTIGHRGVFSLTGWFRLLPAEFHVLRGTQDPTTIFWISPTGLSPSSAGLPRPFCYPYDSILWSYNPDALRRRFGLFPFRSPLLRESRLFSLPPGTEMFHFPGFAPISG